MRVVMAVVLFLFSGSNSLWLFVNNFWSDDTKAIQVDELVSMSESWNESTVGFPPWTVNFVSSAARRTVLYDTYLP